MSGSRSAPTPAGKPVIGLVGGIGAGKSTVARMLAEMGCEVISGDEIGHRLLQTDEVRSRLVELWGQRILDAGGEVDRGAVAELVFSDPQELARLNEILHPRIRRRLEEAIARARARCDVWAVVLDAAVLFEAGWDDLCTHVLMVRADEPTRRERVLAGRGWDERQWRARERAQIPVDRKERLCSHRIDNRSGVGHLRSQVRALLSSLTGPDRESRQ